MCGAKPLRALAGAIDCTKARPSSLEQPIRPAVSLAYRPSAARRAAQGAGTCRKAGLPGPPECDRRRQQRHKDPGVRDGGRNRRGVRRKHHGKRPFRPQRLCSPAVVVTGVPTRPANRCGQLAGERRGRGVTIPDRAEKRGGHAARDDGLTAYRPTIPGRSRGGASWVQSSRGRHRSRPDFRPATCRRAAASPQRLRSSNGPLNLRPNQIEECNARWPPRRHA